MMQDGVVQHDHPGRFERAGVDRAVELVVAQMVEPDVGSRRCDFTDPCARRPSAVQPNSPPPRCAPAAAESRTPLHSGFLPFAEQRRAHAHVSGAFLDGHLQVVRHAHGKLRQFVLRRQFAQPAEVTAASLQDRPTTAAWSSSPAGSGSDKRVRRRSVPAIARATAPLLACSGESFTSIITSSSAPSCVQPRASFAESTVWMHWKISRGPLGFVRLQMSDQVKSRIHQVADFAETCPSNSCT